MKKLYRRFFSAVLSFVFMLSVFVSVTCAAPTASAEEYVIFDAESGQILFEKAGTVSVNPSFAARVMAVLIAAENVNLENKVTVSETAVAVEKNASKIGLVAGEQIRYKDLMYAAIIYGAEDAANAIAEGVSGSAADFAVVMNTRAVQFGAVNTNFTNASGAYDAEAFTTAHDTALILRYALKNSVFSQIYTARSYDIPPTNKRDTVYSITKSDFRMIDSESPYFYPGATGGAVGYVQQDGSSGFAVATNGGMTVAAVIFGAKNIAERYASFKGLLDYTFENFVRKTVSVKPATVPVVENNMVVATVAIYSDESITYLLHKSLDETAVTSEVNLQPMYTRYNITPTVTVSVAGADQLMYENIGTYMLKYTLTDIAEPYPYSESEKPTDPAQTPTEPTQKKGMSLWIKIPLIIIGVIAALVVLVVLLFVIENVRRRKLAEERRRLRRLQARRAEAAGKYGAGRTEGKNDKTTRRKTDI